jgi:hypothetical protein
VLAGCSTHRLLFHVWDLDVLNTLWRLSDGDETLFSCAELVCCATPCMTAPLTPKKRTTTLKKRIIIVKKENTHETTT